MSNWPFETDPFYAVVMMGFGIAGIIRWLMKSVDKPAPPVPTTASSPPVQTAESSVPTSIETPAQGPAEKEAIPIPESTVSFEQFAAEVVAELVPAPPTITLTQGAWFLSNVAKLGVMKDCEIQECVERINLYIAQNPWTYEIFRKYGDYDGRCLAITEAELAVVAPVLPGYAPVAEPVYPDTEVLDHVLVWGPPGTGKTALARIIANTLGEVYGFDPQLLSYTPLSLKTDADVLEMVQQVAFGTLIFIDEIHGIEKSAAEALYNVLEYGVLYDRRGRGTRPPKHTFIGATTEPGTLLEPFRERFQIEVELKPLEAEDIDLLLFDYIKGLPFPETFDEYQGQEEAKAMVLMHIKALNKRGYVLTPTVRREISRRSVGIPRIAKNITRHMMALSKASDRVVSPREAQQCFELLGIDHNGLHRADRRVIEVLMKRNNTPMGVAALASAAGISKSDLESMVEGRLVRLGYLERTPRGRALTPKAIEAYGKFDIVNERAWTKSA